VGASINETLDMRPEQAQEKAKQERWYFFLSFF